MVKAIIYDLDQTIIDSQIAEQERRARNWNLVYQKIKNFQIYEGFKEVFEKIRLDGIKVGIVTNSPETYAIKVIDQFGIPCDCLIDFFSVSKRKPNPEPFLKAIELLDVLATDSISFGDRQIDIQASNAAEIISVACTWGTLEYEKLKNSNPTKIISKPIQILQFL